MKLKCLHEIACETKWILSDGILRPNGFWATGLRSNGFWATGFWDRMDIERWMLCRRDYLRRDFEIEPKIAPTSNIGISIGNGNCFSSLIWLKLDVTFHPNPRVWNSGFGSGRVLHEAQIRRRVGSGNTFLGSGLTGFGYPLAMQNVRSRPLLRIRPLWPRWAWRLASHSPN